MEVMPKEAWPAHQEIEEDTACFGPFRAPGAEITLEPRERKLYLHWRAASAEALCACVAQIRPTISPRGFQIYMEFVPVSFEAGLLAGGFQPHSEYLDGWLFGLDRLDGKHQPPCTVKKIESHEYFEAAAITQACRSQSRGFEGETIEWVIEWMSDPDHNAFLALQRDQPVGVIFTGLYPSVSRGTQVCWVRDLAVRPESQGQGIGRALLFSALDWGKSCGATISFLSVDRLNKNAIHLYEQIGYQFDPGRGQINMVHPLGEG